jgi:hypothetical protein
LMRAVAHALPWMTACLLEKGADIKGVNHKGKSVMDMAEGSRNRDVLDVLREFIQQNGVDMRRERSRSRHHASRRPRGRAPSPSRGSGQHRGREPTGAPWHQEGQQTRGREPQRRGLTLTPAPGDGAGSSSSGGGGGLLLARASAARAAAEQNRQAHAATSRQQPTSWAPSLWPRQPRGDL